MLKFGDENKKDIKLGREKLAHFKRLSKIDKKVYDREF